MIQNFASGLVANGSKWTSWNSMVNERDLKPVSRNLTDRFSRNRKSILIRLYSNIMTEGGGVNQKHFILEEWQFFLKIYIFHILFFLLKRITLIKTTCKISTKNKIR